MSTNQWHILCNSLTVGSAANEGRDRWKNRTIVQKTSII